MNNSGKRFEKKTDHFESAGGFEFVVYRCQKHKTITFSENDTCCILCEREALLEDDNNWEEGSVVACEKCRGNGVVSFPINNRPWPETEYDIEECENCDGKGYFHHE